MPNTVFPSCITSPTPPDGQVSYSCRLGASLCLVVCWREELLPPGLFLRDLVGRITFYLLLLRSQWLKGRHPTSAPSCRGRPPLTVVSPHGCISGIPRKNVTGDL